MMKIEKSTAPRTASANTTFRSVPLAILGMAHLVCLAAIAMAIA